MCGVDVLLQLRYEVWVLESLPTVDVVEGPRMAKEFKAVCVEDDPLVEVSHVDSHV